MGTKQWASAKNKEREGDNSFSPQPLPLLFLCCSPLPTSPHFFCSPQTRLFARSCSISPPAKWKGNVCYACRMPQNSRSLQSNHVLSPIKISASSRTKIAEEGTSSKRQPVTHLFRCDWSTALLFFSVFFLQKLYFLLTKKKKCFIRHRHKTSSVMSDEMFCAQLVSKPKEPLQKQNNIMAKSNKNKPK